MSGGRWRDRAAVASLALSALAAAGCGTADGPGALGPEDHRYRAIVESASPADGRDGALLRFEAREGWHIVPEAAARLELEAPEGVELERSSFGGEDALEHSERALVFALALPAPATPDGRLRARVRFGICRDDEEGCEIVRSELELPL